jgi:phage tail-like protein
MATQMGTQQQFVMNGDWSMEIGDDTVAVFTEVQGGGFEIQSAKNYSRQKDKTVISIQAGAKKFNPYTCKQGLTVGDQSIKLTQWLNDVANGNAQAYRNITLILRDTSGKPVIAHHLTDAIITKYQLSGAKAEGAAMMLAEITIDYAIAKLEQA